MFDRLLNRFTGGRKSKSHVHFKADKGSFEAVITYSVNRNFFLQAWNEIQKRVVKLQGKSPPKSFEIPEKLLGVVRKQASKTLKKFVKKQVKKDLPEFRMLSMLVESAKIEQIDQSYLMVTKITGVCKGD